MSNEFQYFVVADNYIPYSDIIIVKEEKIIIEYRKRCHDVPYGNICDNTDKKAHCSNYYKYARGVV
jgi:hypothetical protein